MKKVFFQGVGKGLRQQSLSVAKLTIVLTIQEKAVGSGCMERKFRSSVTPPTPHWVATVFG